MPKKKTIIFIHGAETYRSDADFYAALKRFPFSPNGPDHKRKYWRKWLIERIGRSYDFICPTMPNKQSADYRAWKIWFERTLEYCKLQKKTSAIFIGHSLGGTFLLKYFSENKVSVEVEQLHLVSAPIEDSGMHDESLNTFALNHKKISSIQKKAKNIFIYHSSDDTLVPFEQCGELAKLLPQAKVMTFKDRWHFLTPRFPELLKNVLLDKKR